VFKIIFVAYREWAIKVFPYISAHPKVSEAVFCKTYNELYKLDLTNFDLLITLGLSSKIENDVYEKIETIGSHCAELDRYSYGSPIQLQIIDGIIKTKNRVFRLRSENLGSLRSHAHTREYSHEVDLYLHGGIAEIFEQLTYTSISVFNRFLDDYPSIQWKQWPEESIKRNRRTPEDSKISINDLQEKSTKELYNLFRSLEDPYPNAYIEDEKGILYFKKVIFKEKRKE
jgi:hypothetical protein